MKKEIIKVSYGAWLGISLAIAGIHLASWKFFLIVIPTILLVLWREDNL